MIRIRHQTIYRYHSQVALMPHRLMLRPRESRGQRVISFSLLTEPVANITWGQDVFGNTIATATFSRMTDSLTIESALEVQTAAVAWRLFAVSPSAASFPFRYSDEEWADLGGLAIPQYADPKGRLRRWAQDFIRSNPTDTLSLLMDINAGVANSISYQTREDEGTQSPLQTLERGWGACRDLAILFIEAVRVIGFGARIVSGYLDSRSAPSELLSTTHAWAEAYLPGAGWVAFDPTNRTSGGGDLVPVAVGRNIHQVMPVTGSFVGMAGAFSTMSARVFH